MRLALRGFFVLWKTQMENETTYGNNRPLRRQNRLRFILLTTFFNRPILYIRWTRANRLSGSLEISPNKVSPKRVTNEIRKMCLPPKGHYFTLTDDRFRFANSHGSQKDCRKYVRKESFNHVNDVVETKPQDYDEIWIRSRVGRAFLQD